MPSKILAVSKPSHVSFSQEQLVVLQGDGTDVVVVDSYWRVVGIVIYCFFQVVCEHNSPYISE